MVKVPKGYRSKNVQDRRTGGGGRRGGGFGFPGSGSGGGSGNLGGQMGGGGLGGQMGGGAARMPGGAGRKGCGLGGLIVMLLVLALLFVMCRGAANSFNTGDIGGPATSAAPSNTIAPTESFELVNFVLDDVQNYWIGYFADNGEQYQEAQLILFDNSVNTGGCGRATSQVGPFYCPADSNAYIDLQFMAQLQRQLGAEGDFAQAYILAHEIGHHVQNVVGTNAAVREAQNGQSRAVQNQFSVRMELQADCLAGMWAKSAEEAGILEVGDIEEGVRAAGAVGDDAITGSSNAESFTHGTSQQRIRWLRRGLDTGDYNNCDTFSPSYNDL